jgi:hypothetical protein
LSYFILGRFLIQKSLTSGTHLSDVARHVGPARQRAIAAWLPRAARPDSRPRSRHRRPNRLADRAVARTAAVPPRPPRSPLAVRHAAVSVPVNRRSLSSPVRRRRAVVGSPSSAVIEPRRSRTVPPSRAAHCAGWPSWAALWAVRPRGRGPRPRCATGLSVISAQWHPVKFYYFLIYSIHYKFKNLCMIHLNSENYETNFVGKG